MLKKSAKSEAPCRPPRSPGLRYSRGYRLVRGLHARQVYSHLVAPWASEINFDEDLAPAIIEREVRVIRGGDHQVVFIIANFDPLRPNPILRRRLMRFPSSRDDPDQ
jgi:hypothetical protein